jgi:putative oxidoreductase
MDIASWSPRMLSVLRIMTGLLFLEHGTQKLLGFPPPVNPGPALLSLLGFQGILELVGGILILIGLFTRPVAFILAGDMAVAYFYAHAPRGFFPTLNGGQLAILFCFVFLYLFVAGAGVWSVDEVRSRSRSLELRRA